MLNVDDITIVIEQLRQSRKVKGIEIWDAFVSIFIEAESNAPLYQYNVAISDPFTNDQHSDLSFYLNELMGLKTLNKRKDMMIKCPALIAEYQQRLMEQLDLRHQISNIHNCDRFSGRAIKIEIQTKKGFLSSTRSGAKSLQSLHWEVLEESKLWMDIQFLQSQVMLNPASVRVRRKIEAGERRPGVRTATTPRGLPNVPSDQDTKRDDAFKVLLVVARRLTNNPDIWSPTIVQAAVLKVRAKYFNRISGMRIVIKVARPGSLERFKEILNSDNFDVVHFDMHGRISENSRGELLFNQDTAHNLTEDWKEGDRIAEIVKDKKIRCVVIGACESGRADTVAHANLAWAFVRQNVQNVLAMSFKVTDKMSQKFFDAFYFALFAECREFSEAARYARSKILFDSARWHYNTEEPKNIVDWFIPVVYSDGTQFFATKDQRHSPITGLLQLQQEVLEDLLCYVSLLLSGVLACWCLYFCSLRFGLLAILFLALLSWGVYCWRSLRSKKQEEFIDALNVCREDRSNVLRLEHDLYRARSVFFNCINEGPVGKGLTQLLQPLLKVWEHTHLIDGVVELDLDCFRNRFCWRRVYGFWRIWSWKRKTSGKPRRYEPHLLVLIRGVHKLYSDQTDGALLEGRKRLESWINNNFGLVSLDDPGVFAPYLIIVGEAPTGNSYDQGVGATQNWIRNNLKKVTALQRMAANVFEETPLQWLAAERPLLYQSGITTGGTGNWGAGSTHMSPSWPQSPV